MPQAQKKVISIILEQCAKIEERCEGYREELADVVTDILACEHDHRVSATNVQKKINDKFDATARLLVRARGEAAEELAS